MSAERISVLVKFPPELLAKVDASRLAGEPRMAAIVRLVGQALQPYAPTLPAASPYAAVKAEPGDYAYGHAHRLTGPVDPITGKPLAARGPMQKGGKK